MKDDERLRQTFRKLREADAERVPTFEAIRSRPAARRPRSLWLLVGPVTGSMAAAAVILLWCNAERNAAAPPIAATAGARAPAGAAPVDTAPLDFLLESPSRGLLAATPRLDTAFLDPPTGGRR